jgi:hypothetical protein
MSHFQVRFLFNKTKRRTEFSKFIYVKKLYMFRTVPLPITSLMAAFKHDLVVLTKLPSNLHDIYQCRMYSGKLLMMGRGTARNM